MTKLKPKYINIRESIPGLRRLLDEWMKVSIDYVEAMEGDDCPWQYNEIAVTGFLAAAAWRLKSLGNEHKPRGALQVIPDDQRAAKEGPVDWPLRPITYVKPHAFVFERK